MPDQDFNPSSEEVSDYLKSNPDLIKNGQSQSSAFSQLWPYAAGIAAPAVAKGATALAGKVGLSKLPTYLSTLFLVNKSRDSSGDVYDILNEGAGKVGSLSSEYYPEHKQIFVHGLTSNVNTGLPVGNTARDLNYAAHSLGTNNIRSIIDALKLRHPEAETLRAFRSSGARPDMYRSVALKPGIGSVTGSDALPDNPSSYASRSVELPNSHQVEDLKDTIVGRFPEERFVPRQHANPYVAYFLENGDNGPRFSMGFSLRNKPDSGPHILIDKSTGAITHNIPGFDFPSHVNDILSGY